MPEDSGGSVAAAPSSGGQSSDGTSNVHNVYMDRTPSSESSSHTAQPNSASESNGNGDGNGNGKKELSRYERTKRERQEFRRQQQLFAQEREQFNRQRQEFEESKKPKRNYTFQELQQYREGWAKDGNFELVEAADKELAAMQQEEAAKYQNQRLPVQGTPEHRQLWEKAEQELYEIDQDFMREGTALDNELRSLFNGPDGNLYRQHPQGIIAAYHRVKMGLLQNENSKLKQELQRYQGFTSIGGGAPGSKPSSGRVESLGDFSKLSTKDMKKHLLSSIGRGSSFV